MDSYERELVDAKAAVARAISALDEVDRSVFETSQKRHLTTIRKRLERASHAEHGWWDETHPVVVVYEAARQALDAIAKLERIDAGQATHFASATRALHEAEDVLNDPYWRGDLSS